MGKDNKNIKRKNRLYEEMIGGLVIILLNLFWNIQSNTLLEVRNLLLLLFTVFFGIGIYFARKEHKLAGVFGIISGVLFGVTGGILVQILGIYLIVISIAYLANYNKNK